MLADFEVTTHAWGTPRTVRVCVYETLAAMRAAATRYDNQTRSRRRRVRNGHKDTCGVCHRFEWLDPDTMESQPSCAIVRLAPPHLGAGIVAHELTHAATWIRHLHLGDAPMYDGREEDDEEEFAWLVGELVSTVVAAMYDRGIYPSETED